jgi:tRNA (guanine37-N1)-methyltransferase
VAVKFKILTLFKEAFTSYLDSSIIKRAIDTGEIEVELIDFRDYSINKHRKVDDTTYGGGPGMVLTVQPLYDAIQDVKEEEDLLIFLTPNGKLLNQQNVIRYKKDYEGFVLVCGKYEGFDARIFELFSEHEKLSIGDYILTGGELPALVFLDAVSRYTDVLHNDASVEEESFTNGLLEYDQYTKPAEFMGKKVPEILLSGHHAKIEEFRRKSSIINTFKNRPELLDNVVLNKDEHRLINKLKNSNNKTEADEKNG